MVNSRNIIFYRQIHDFEVLYLFLSMLEKLHCLPVPLPPLAQALGIAEQRIEVMPETWTSPATFAFSSLLGHDHLSGNLYRIASL